MSVESGVRLIGGTFVLASTLLGIYVDARFLWFTAFVGANLVQSAFTGWCPMMTMLRKAGLPEHRGAASVRSAASAHS
jgi:Inner membrane protein YgaP-like, transmembrane domain